MAVEDTIIISPSGYVQTMASPTSQIGAALGGLAGAGISKFVQHKKDKKAREFLDTSNAPDWIKALGQSSDPQKAIEMYGEYKFKSENRAIDQANDIEKLKLKADLDNSAIITQGVTKLVNDLAVLEKEAAIKKEQLKDLSSAEQEQIRFEFNLKQEELKKQKQRIKDAILNHGAGIGLVDKKTRESFANIVSETNADTLKSLIEQKTFLSGGGGESVGTVFGELQPKTPNASIMPTGTKKSETSTLGKIFNFFNQGANPEQEQ